jgi:uncharacterized protein (TIGR02058 family)
MDTCAVAFAVPNRVTARFTSLAVSRACPLRAPRSSSLVRGQAPPRAMADAGTQSKAALAFVEIGTGCDLHGQSATKAATRACRGMWSRVFAQITPAVGSPLCVSLTNLVLLYLCLGTAAVEFNSLPSLRRLLPNGDLSQMRVHVVLGVPEQFMTDVDVALVRAVFPYGTVTTEIVLGGLCTKSGIVLADQDDPEGDDRAIVVVASVEVYA